MSDSSRTVVANLALSNLGIEKKISNVDTDRSQEANVIRQFFDTCLEQALGDSWWGFNRKFADLQLVENCPTPEWLFSYRYPSDCVLFRRILSGRRTDTRQSRVSYIIANDDQGQLIYCNQDCAKAEYSKTDCDPATWTADFKFAFSYVLSEKIAPGLTGGDPYGMIAKMQALYTQATSKAEAKNGIQEQPDIEPQSEFIRARGGCDRSRRGLYPWGV